MASPVSFLKEVKSELAQVSWPSKEETIRLTSVVVAISLGVGFLLGAVDFSLTKIMEILLKK